MKKGVRLKERLKGRSSLGNKASFIACRSQGVAGILKEEGEAEGTKGRDAMENKKKENRDKVMRMKKKVTK